MSEAETGLTSIALVAVIGRRLAARVGRRRRDGVRRRSRTGTRPGDRVLFSVLGGKFPISKPQSKTLLVFAIVFSIGAIPIQGET